MNNIEKRDKGLAYISDDSVFEQQKNARRLTQEFNTADRADFKKLQSIIEELFAKCENPFVNPPFYCDYGFNIEVGKNFFANYNCCFLDVAKIKIGDNCFIAPNVSIYTTGHAIYPTARIKGYEYGAAVTIGDNVWFGGNVTVLPGVTIGSNSVIGAGSVVTHDIPSGVVAVGNPCKVLREITEKDSIKFH